MLPEISSKQATYRRPEEDRKRQYHRPSMEKEQDTPCLSETQQRELLDASAIVWALDINNPKMSAALRLGRPNNPAVGEIVEYLHLRCKADSYLQNHPAAKAALTQMLFIIGPAR